MHRRRYRVLIVEDEPDDRFLLERVFRKVLGDQGSVHLVADGEEAIAYVRGDGKYADRKLYPFPSFILTDLNMPKVDGFGFLEFLKANPAWNVIPRIVFSSSEDDDDIRTAYLVGATVYHRKPATLERLKECAQHMVDYWITCEVPPMDETGRLLKTDRRGKLGERFGQPEGGPRMDRPPDV